MQLCTVCQSMKITDTSFRAVIQKGIPFETLNAALKDKYNLHPVYAYTDIYEQICRREGILENIEYMLESYAEVDSKPFLLVKLNANANAYPMLFNPKAMMQRFSIYKQTLYVKPEVYSFMLMSGFLDLQNKCHVEETTIKDDL